VPGPGRWFNAIRDHPAFALEPRDLQLSGLHPSLAEECVLRIVRKGLHPIAQLRRMHV
jgi:hypothetical protein